MDTVTNTASIGNTAYHLGEYGVCISGKSLIKNKKQTGLDNVQQANTLYHISEYAVSVCWEDRLDKKLNNCLGCLPASTFVSASL